MERRVAEAVLDSLSDGDYQRLHAIAVSTTEQLVRLLAENARSHTPDATDSDPKPGEPDDEPERRMATLRRVKAAQVVGALLAEVIGDVTATEAANAVWLGASLADLGSASGNTRQAARKRWPDLGQIYRTRRWLTGHHEDILCCARMLIDVREDTRPKPDVDPETSTAAYDVLIAGLERMQEDFASGSVISGSATSNARTIRWQRLGELVDRRIRGVVDVVTATDDESDHAISGAIGLLAHYDAIHQAPAR